MLKIGRKAPTYKLLDHEGQERSHKELLGKWTIIYFYPKDDTPGCTKEACLIGEIYKDFKRQGVRVIGVSKDSVKSHKKFAEKYQLPFTLLADDTTNMIQSYGAWGEKQFRGRKYLGTLRVSYLIAPDGKIAQVYPTVDPATHAAELLKDLKTFIKAARLKEKIPLNEA